MTKTIPQKDLDRLRELGKRLAEIAALPDQERHKKIWTAVNDGNMIVPAVLTRDYPIYLLDIDGALSPTVEDDFLKTVEADLLLKIYEWEHLRCHRVISPFVNCQADYTDSGMGVKIAAPGADAINFVQSQEISSARHYDRIISCEEDLGMIKTPEVIHNEKSTARRLEMMHEVFDGIIDVKLHGAEYFLFVPWDDLLSWMGIEEGMYDFVLNPDFMHMAVERYVDAYISCVKQYEALGLLTSNNQNHFVGAGGYGYTSFLAPPTESGIGAKLKDNWGLLADQVLHSVSPEMCQEFAFIPEKRYADLFGRIYYGCCERLDQKLEELKTFTNLRKVSMSPYANIEEGMEKIGNNKNLVVSFKPNSNYLVTNPPQFDLLREELIKVCGLARKYNCNVEILMKTLISLQGEPQRLWKWCDLAMEIVDNY